jgi:23S rRNA (uracil1939-C5)-methyltransferase
MAELFKAKIEKIAAGGAGLARIEGKSVFIEGTVPGETVLCRITEEHRSWLWAELLEIVETSHDRVKPVCGLYGICGGCNLQHLDYTAQITAKTTILTDNLTRIGGFCPPQPQVFPSSSAWKYRNRMQFHAVRQNPAGANPQQSVSWGLKARKKADIVPIHDCPIADPGIQEVLQGRGEKALRFLPPEKERFTVYARNGLLLCEGENSRGKTRILDRELVLEAGVFFQSNGAMLEKLILDLQEIAGRADRNMPAADLYCGVGTFAAFLDTMFPHIDLIEENKTALALARENLTQPDSAALYAQRSENWAKNNMGHRRYGFMVLDPPRQGLAPELASRLVANGPPLLAYVSCDPATLARDSKILLKGGYGLTELRWYDFYPQTAHIESLSVFSRH